MACLYVVATPIGNLGDISARGLEIMGTVNLIIAEDTRIARKLLANFDLKAKVVSCYKDNETRRSPQLIAEILNANIAALVSDAGTPGLRDPGQVLINRCWQEGITVTPIPGPSAITTALSVCGFQTDEFVFHGYLPEKMKDRKEVYEKISECSMTQVLFIPPHDAREILRDLAVHLGTRRCLLAREITKKFESFYRGDVNEILVSLPETIKGEITFIIEKTDRPKSTAFNPLLHLSTIEHLLHLIHNEGYNKKEAIKDVAQSRQLPKKEIYKIAVKLYEK